MYYISKDKNNVLLHVYDSSEIDPGVEKFPISDEEFEMIYASGIHEMWKFESGVIIKNDKYTPIETIDSSSIPKEIL